MQNGGNFVWRGMYVACVAAQKGLDQAALPLHSTSSGFIKMAVANARDTQFCWCRYPPGARRAMVVLRGKDSQFWAGNYGAKFASPSLAFACDGTGAAEAAVVDEDMA